MTNSHIAEALAQAALRFNDRELRLRAADFITAFIRMMFFDGDPRRPNCFEHYNPLTGVPSIYRGVDDYQHSWVVDLLIKYLCGVRVGPSAVVVDPFPFAVSELAVYDLRIRGHRLDVERRGKHFSVRIDGKTAGKSVLAVPLVVRLPGT